MLFDQAIDIPEVLLSGAVTAGLVAEKRRYNLRIKAGDVAAFKKTSKLKLPVKINTASISNDMSCFKLGPDEWIVIADPSKRQELDAVFHDMSNVLTFSVTDISHRNVALELSGPKAETLLNVGCPLDLSLAAFPIGKVTRTVFESAQIMIARVDEQSFYVETWRSFGPYLRDFFERVVTTR